MLHFHCWPRHLYGYYGGFFEQIEIETYLTITSLFIYVYSGILKLTYFR